MPASSGVLRLLAQTDVWRGYSESQIPLTQQTDVNAHGTQPYLEIPPQVLHALLPVATGADDWATSARNTLQITGNKDGLWKFCFRTQLKPAAVDSAELKVILFL